MTGREPMNPRPGQFGLAGTVSAWTRLTSPTTKQRDILRRAYRGLDLRVYGRYGHRQWSAPLPWIRIIVKDPFALLSVETIVGVTGALPVLIYRHPGAVLASYRRMGWKPDIEELENVAPEFERLDREICDDDVERMSWFWTVAHRIALEQLTRTPSAVVVSHQELSMGGPAAVRTLFDACNLRWSHRTSDEVDRWSQSSGLDPAAGDRLHVLNRSPKEVSDAWRKRLDPDDVVRVEKHAHDVFAELERRRLPL